jgi:hypothetical protein
VKHLVRELGSTDNEHPTGHDARQREQLAAGPPAPGQGLHRPALKRDRVPQSSNTRTSIQSPERTTGLSREFPLV